MHVPLLPAQAAAAGLAGLDLDTQCHGVMVALATAMRQRVDLQNESGGAVA